MSELKDILASGIIPKISSSEIAIGDKPVVPDTDIIPEVDNDDDVERNGLYWNTDTERLMYRTLDGTLHRVNMVEVHGPR
jgi:hypothetical protein